MHSKQTYSKAPITEAILDIQVEKAPSYAASMLLDCQDQVRADYPTKRELKTAIAQFTLDEYTASASASSPQVHGFAFISEDKKQLFQVRADGFTANRLAPYSGWNTFGQEARRLWDIYRTTTKPTRVTRIALRYINRIDIPSSRVELKDYFHTSPEVAPGLPQTMAGFFMQIVLPLEDVKATVNIVETIVEPLQPGNVSVVLDLDFFRTVELPGTEEELWALFEILRAKKNVVFDTCITEKTKKLIR